MIRDLMLLALPLGDLVRFLGTMVAGHAPGWVWWPIGLILHASVGAIWATFYAYFFWSTFDWRPALQGLAFSVIPILLAGLVMLPQLGWMHPLVLRGEIARPGLFGIGDGWGGPAAIVLGHLIYGVTVGALYTRPVGYPTGQTQRCVMSLSPRSLVSGPMGITHPRSLTVIALGITLLVTACGRAIRREVVNPPGISPLVPAYSVAIRHGEIVFVSGMTGIKPGTQEIIDGGVAAQTRQALENIRASLQTAGATMADVGECTVFLIDMADYAG